MHRSFLLASLVSVSGFLALPANCQVPGTRLTVDVKVETVALRGDTVGVTYVLFNHPDSQDSVWTFTVDAPAGLKMIMEPSPADDWSVDTVYAGRQVADWASLQLIPPANNSPALYFESVGLPGIVDDWVGGHFPIPDNDTTPNDPLTHQTVKGKTVGVELFPANRSSEALLVRLGSLTQSACSAPLSWVSDATLCSNLTSELVAAESYRANGQLVQARNSLDSYMTSLSGQVQGTFANGVTSPGYWLLRSNAQIAKSSF